MEDLGITIAQLVQDELPAGFSVNEVYLARRLKVWQLMFHGAADVIEADMYNIDAYSGKWQILLGYMILHDIIQKILLGGFIKVTGSSDSDGTAKGEVKKITTGPSDVEFHNSSEALAAIIKALQAGGSLIGNFLSTACMFAGSMGIQLPFCPTKNVSVGPVIMKNCNSPSLKPRCNECLPKPKSLG